MQGSMAGTSDETEPRGIMRQEGGGGEEGGGEGGSEGEASSESSGEEASGS